MVRSISGFTPADGTKSSIEAEKDRAHRDVGDWLSQILDR
jgi:hypothetical protein